MLMFKKLRLNLTKVLEKDHLNRVIDYIEKNTYEEPMIDFSNCNFNNVKYILENTTAKIIACSSDLTCSKYIKENFDLDTVKVVSISKNNLEKAEKDINTGKSYVLSYDGFTEDMLLAMKGREGLLKAIVADNEFYTNPVGNIFVVINSDLDLVAGEKILNIKEKAIKYYPKYNNFKYYNKNNVMGNRKCTECDAFPICKPNPKSSLEEFSTLNLVDNNTCSFFEALVYKYKPGGSLEGELFNEKSMEIVQENVNAIVNVNKTLETQGELIKANAIFMDELAAGIGSLMKLLTKEAN